MPSNSEDSAFAGGTYKLSIRRDREPSPTTEAVANETDNETLRWLLTQPQKRKRQYLANLEVELPLDVEPCDGIPFDVAFVLEPSSIVASVTSVSPDRRRFESVFLGTKYTTLGSLMEAMIAEWRTGQEALSEEDGGETVDDVLKHRKPQTMIKNAAKNLLVLLPAPSSGGTGSGAPAGWLTLADAVAAKAIPTLSVVQTEGADGVEGHAVQVTTGQTATAGGSVAMGAPFRVWLKGCKKMEATVVSWTHSGKARRLTFRVKVDEKVMRAEEAVRCLRKKLGELVPEAAEALSSTTRITRSGFDKLVGEFGGREATLYEMRCAGAFGQ